MTRLRTSTICAGVVVAGSALGVSARLMCEVEAVPTESELGGFEGGGSAGGRGAVSEVVVATLKTPSEESAVAGVSTGDMSTTGISGRGGDSCGGEVS